jgi:hypothetical protein
LPVADEDVSVIVLPAQKALGPLIVGVAGVGFSITTNGADAAEQPSAFVTRTVYVPAVETMIDCVVAPVDQRFPVAEEDVSVIVLPAQKDDGPLIVGVAGVGFSVTTNGVDVAEQPLAFVTRTVYEPALETAIDCVVSPFDQRLPVDEDDVSVIEVPAQNDDGPLIVGASGVGLTVTSNAADVAAQPPASVTVTV